MADDKENPEYHRNPDDVPVGLNPPQSPGPMAPDAEKPSTGIESENWLIQKARDMYATSTDYVEANITKQWETNLNHFNNQHSSDSRFSARNMKRSKVFRPKTRSMVRGQEAAMAVAAFGSENMLILTPEDPDNSTQRISAQISKSIMDYRLRKSMKWFLTALGAYQDTKVYGLCISHQYWRYDEDTDIEPALDENGDHIKSEDGTPMGVEKTVVRCDWPVCDLVAPDLFRFDPMCDWRDPANTSPYLIYMMPIYAGDALEKMEQIHKGTGKPVWMKHDLAQILGTVRQDFTRTRQAREGDRRVDPAEQRHGNEFTTVWAHLNILRVNGEDYGYWTMGTELLLTKAAPLRKMYPHLRAGERPFVIGVSSFEAHKNYPAGDVELASGLQSELNTVANQRLDNVKLVLNKRYYVKRGSQVDLDALMRNVPGGGVMMNDPEKDVKTVETNDVTKSSYVEQDRLAVEMDELVGSFSQSSVQSNRTLGETVGGMSMMQQSSGSIQDYGIRVFMVTWMEPVLDQIVRLVQMYETDTVVLGVAAKKSELWTRFGTDKVTDEYLRQSLTINVDVGIGNTDPVRRVERLAFGVKNVLGLPNMAARVKSSEIANEVFGSIGYKSADRFFMNDTEYKNATDKQPPQPPMEIQLEQMKIDQKKFDTESRMTLERERMAMEERIRTMEIKAGVSTKSGELDSKEQIATENRQSTEKVASLSNAIKTRELNMKTVSGSGI
jgi:hypothetical protein